MDAVFVCFVFVLGTRVSYLRHIGFFLFFLFLSSTPLFPLHFHVFLFFKFILILSSTNSTVQSDVKVSRFFTLSLSLCCCWVFCLLVFRFCALLSLTLMNYMTTTSFFYSTSEISGKTTINTKNTTLYKQKTKKRKKERKKGMLSGKPQNVFCSFIKNILSSNEGDNQTLGFKMEESLRESPNTRLFFKRLLARIANCGLESHSARAARDTETTDISRPISSPVCFVLPRNRHFLSLCFSFSVTRLSRTTDQRPFVLARN